MYIARTHTRDHTHTHIYIYIHIYAHMSAVDLKVLARSFDCESRACYVGNPRESFCGVRERTFFIRESFAKVGYYESLSLYTLQLVKGHHLLPPGVRQDNGTAP